MADIHGAQTVLLITTSVAPTGGDMSIYVQTSTFSGMADVHDRTTYGRTSKVYSGGLKDKTFTMAGFYDTTGTNAPNVILFDREGTTFQITRRTEGTGSNLPQQVFDAVLSSYVETNPHNELVTFTADFQVSDDIDTTDQS